jgi:hypothetical protein
MIDRGEIESWVEEINEKIKEEMDEWSKERLKIEKAAYIRVLEEGRKEKYSDRYLLKMLFLFADLMSEEVINALEKSDEMLSYGEIAEKIGESWRHVAFRLMELDEYGLVEGEFRVVELPKSPDEPGRARKFYKLTPKVGEVMSQIVDRTRR